MRFSLKHLLLLAMLLSTAFGLRVAAARWWEARLPEEQQFGFGDSEGYWELGRAIARGEPYQYGEYRVFRTPGYPLLLAPLFWLVKEPPVMWARIEGALLGTIAVALAMLITWKLFDERAAWIAGLIATFYPGQIASSVFVLSEAPFIPLMLGQLLAWITSAKSDCQRGRIGYAILAGILAGLATLVRPSWLLATPFVILLALIFSSQRKQHFVTGAVMLLALCVTMSPWWVRNYYVTGRFVPTTLQVGISLADGLNPKATGASNLEILNGQLIDFRDHQSTTVPFSPQLLPQFIQPTPQSTYEWLQIEEEEDIGPSITFGLPFDEVDLDREWRIEATRWAWGHPLRTLQLAGIKFLRMWNFVPNADNFSSWKLRLVYAATYTPVLICCLAGLWTFRARGFPYLLCFVPAVYFTLLHMIFVSSIRYQQPAIIAWMVLGAGWVSLMTRRRASA